MIIVVVHGRICGINKEIGGGYVGGIAGYNYDTGIIKNCGNFAEVITETEEYENGGAGYTGGITSINKNIVEKCYNAGKIKASSNREVLNVGGIIGGNYNIVNQCFNIGELEMVPNNDRYIGGIIARNFAESYMNLISGCMYNNEEVNGIGNLEDFEGIIYDSTLNLDKIKQYIKIDNNLIQ